MSGLFKTNEFRFLKKIQKHLEILNTKKNMDVYNEYLQKCIKLAKTKYNNIGWREGSQSYVWGVLDEKIIGPEMINFGDDKDGMSFYPDSSLFMSKDTKYWSVKHSDGVVVKYSPEETKELKNMSVEKLRSIHYIKKSFEGEILSEEAKREPDCKQNKKKFK